MLGGYSPTVSYYYFKSKDDILFAALERELASFMDRFTAIAEDPTLSPLEKLKLAFINLFQPVDPGEAPLTHLISADGSDLYGLHERWDEIRLNRFNPLITKIISEGVAKKDFHTGFPEEITEILFWGISRYIHQHSEHFVDPAYFLEKMKAMEELIGKALGLEGGFCFID